MYATFAAGKLELKPVRFVQVSYDAGKAAGKLRHYVLSRTDTMYSVGLSAFGIDAVPYKG